MTNTGTGTYEVIFNQNVRNCTYVVGGGAPGSLGSGTPGFYNAAGRFSNVNGVFVVTRDTTATAADDSFYLAVFC